LHCKGCMLSYACFPAVFGTQEASSALRNGVSLYHTRDRGRIQVTLQIYLHVLPRLELLHLLNRLERSFFFSCNPAVNHPKQNGRIKIISVYAAHSLMWPNNVLNRWPDHCKENIKFVQAPARCSCELQHYCAYSRG
jgi:hypothetical protein